MGAEVIPDGGVHFSVWAPDREGVEVVLEGGERARPLQPDSHGYFRGELEEVRAGALYRFRLDGNILVPDPASRFQPQGPHGPSQVVDPSQFRWTDATWKGISLAGQVVYELHIGTFTREGTWESATRQLQNLADAGVTLIEVMPVADFPGRFGWGYDGVDLYAPTRLYGAPDDMRRFVDSAHSAGMGVILDVVYNHMGPDGNYLKQFAEDYFTDKYDNEWGAALNFDGPNSGPVREFFIENAAYWISEFHLDGLRLDATQQMFDASPEHLLAAISRRAREAANGRSIVLIAENEPQETRMVRPASEGGYGLDGLWNDDFHHSATVALTGRHEAYYSDTLGEPQEFISAVKYGYLYQGQWYQWQEKPRGTPAFDLSPEKFVLYIQNHDQIANSGRGQRVHELTSPGRFKAMTALLLLAPGTPMLFQGQEFCASAPFLYFADHDPKLADMVDRGRRDFLAQFPSLASEKMSQCFAHPADPSTFERCKLDFTEREKHRAMYDLHRDLLKLRRDDAVFCAQRSRAIDGAVLSGDAFVLRFFGDMGDDRLLIVNLGRDLTVLPAPEPLLAPANECQWKLMWSSEDPRYGGCGTAEATGAILSLSGESAIVLRPEKRER